MWADLSAHYNDLKFLMMKYYLLIGLATLYFSCTNKKKSEFVEVIPVNIENNFSGELLASEIIDLTDVIQLEYSKKSIIGNISRIYRCQNRIYLSSEGELFCFSIKGKFLFKISERGRGPGEYIDLSDFTVDNEIIICDFRQLKLIFYNLEGVYLRDIKVGLRAYNIISYENCLYVNCGQSITEKSKDHLVIYNRENWTKFASHFNIQDYETNYLRYFGHDCFFIYNNKLCFYYPVEPNVYIFKNRELVKIRRFDLGKFMLPESYKSEDFVDVGQFSTKYRRNMNKSIGINYYYEDSQILFINFPVGYKSYSYLYPKLNTEKSIAFNSLKFDLLGIKRLDSNFPIFKIEPRGFDGNELIQPYFLDDIEDIKLKDSIINYLEHNYPSFKLKTIGENPLLIMYKFKRQ